MPGARRRTTGEAGPPTTFPEGDPPAMPFDHSFTLQAVMEMKGSLGELSAKIDRMRDDVTALGTKVDTTSESVATINTTLARWTTGAAVAVAIILILWAIAQIIPWDRISINPPESAAPASR